MIEIGAHSYVDGAIATSWPAANVRIGKFCSIAKGLHCILGGNHRPDYVSTYPFSQMFPKNKGIPANDLPTTKGDIIIGNDVWIGQDVTIMSGVAIGDGAVIGAKSVVARYVLPYGIATGNPAEIRRYRFDSKTVERLLDCRWWDWPEEKIIAATGLLQSNDMEAFLDYAGA